MPTLALLTIPNRFFHCLGRAVRISGRAVVAVLNLTITCSAQSLFIPKTQEPSHKIKITSTGPHRKDNTYTERKPQVVDAITVSHAHS
jgi:hypothetical protein